MSIVSSRYGELAATLAPGAHAPPAAPPAAACRSCAAPLAGPFCAQCGQRDAPADPTLRELLAELAESLLNVDGRVAATFRMLVRRPGALTVEYLRGRRAPYLTPLRVYLVCSVLYFAVAALTPDPVRTIAAAGGGAGPRVEVTGASDEDLARMRARFAEMRRSASPVRRAVGAAVIRAMDDPQGLMRRYEEARPKMMFVLVPVFAAIAARLLGRFRYPAHVVFALHVHAFAFLALILVELGEAVDRLPTVLATTVVAWAAILAYLPLAVRRAYALRPAAALGRGAAVAVVYFLALTVAQLAALAITTALP